MLKKLIVLMFLASIAHSATYYISPSGNDTTGNGTTGTPWATLSKAFDEMSGGDTLIVKDGTYTGTANQITASQKPPVGSAEAWTIIKAENDGAAIFDGESTRGMIDVQYTGTESWSPVDAYTEGRAFYYQFEGMLYARQTVGPQFVRCRYVKFLRCGAYDAADGNVVNFVANRCADFLYENCYSYGSGRYKFQLYCSTTSIIRQCVARADRANPQDEVLAVFALYSAVNCEVQNCIAIDSDQNEDYINVADRAGSFCVPSTDADALNVTFTQCVALNNCFGGLYASGQPEGNQSRNVTFDNCSVIDITNTGFPLNHFKGTDDTVQNCTFIDGAVSGSRGFNGDGGTDSAIKNSIIANYTAGWCLIAIGYEDYNNVYNSTSTNAAAGLWIWCNGSETYGTKGAHTQEINPIWSESNTSGAIKYPVRTEDGNNLEGDGEDGADLGANCLKMVGAQGTMWGETGYNVEQTTDMWPFPYEDLIKTKMAAYSIEDETYDVDGARGFCATGKQLNGTDDITLTSYIWEYLGNEMPADIYGEDVSSPTISGITATVHATSATVTWTTNESANSRVDYGETTGYGSNVTGAAYSTSHSLNITGLSPETLYHYKITTADSTGNSTESADANFTTDAEGEDPPPAGTVGITITGVTITGGISISAD